MAPSACRNVMNGIRDGADQFAAGGGLPRDDADRQRDRGGGADDRHAAGGQPVAARPPGAVEDGAVRTARHRPGADRGSDGALYRSGALLRRPRTHHRRSRRNPRPPHRLAADRSTAGAVERLSAAAHRSLPEGAAEPQPRLLRRDLADRGRLGAEQSVRRRLCRGADRAFRPAEPEAAGAGARRRAADGSSPRGKGSAGAARLRGRDLHLAVGGIVEPAPRRPDLPSPRCPPRAAGGDRAVGDHVRHGVVGAWRRDLRSLHRAGIFHPRRRRAPLPAAHRLRILRGVSRAAQPLAGGARSGRDHAQVACRV